MSGKLPAIPQDPMPDFIGRVRTVVSWLTGQAKNAPVLPKLDANTATTAEIVEAYNLMRQRLDGAD